jgi:hypothetical protein
MTEDAESISPNSVDAGIPWAKFTEMWNATRLFVPYF